MSKAYRVVVLIGGNGSNLQALIDAQSPENGYEIVGVISHNPGVFGLERAQKAKIPAHTCAHRDYENRELFEKALSEVVSSFAPDCIALAGFMRLLTPAFVQDYRRQLINIHPSLLPAYPGLNTHQRVLEAGDQNHGATIHFVTDNLDGGPIIAQARVPVFKNDTLNKLTERVHLAEHWLYPQVLALLAQNRLKYDGKVVTLDDKPLTAQGLVFDSPTAQGS